MGKRSDEFKNSIIDYYMSNNSITLHDVAKKFKCGKNLLGWARKLGRDDYIAETKLRTHILFNTLTEDQKQVILGTLLGDACINCRKGSKRRRTMYVSHGNKQLRYLKWKHAMLNCNNKVMPYTTGYGSLAHRFMFTHPFVEEVWSNNYISDIKHVSADWIKQLNPLGLAVWFQDDGSCSSNGNKYISKAGELRRYYYPRITFATYCFDKCSINNILDGLRHHGFKCRADYTAKGPVVVLSTRAARRFIEAVGKYVMLDYKLNYKRAASSAHSACQQSRK